MGDGGEKARNSADSDYLDLTALHVPPCEAGLLGQRQRRFPRSMAWLSVLALLVAAAATAIWLTDAPYRAIARYLTVSRPPEKADLIIVLSGHHLRSRLEKAANLYTKDYAPRILLSGFAGASDVKEFLNQYPIPEQAVLVDAKSANTYTNATCAAPIIRKEGARTALLVTSWYHSRRALRTFRHLIPNVRFISAPTARNLPTVDRQTVYEEFWKSLYCSFAYIF